MGACQLQVVFTLRLLQSRAVTFLDAQVSAGGQHPGSYSHSGQTREIDSSRGDGVVGRLAVKGQYSSPRLHLNVLEFLTKAGHSPVVWQATVAPFRKYHAFFAKLIGDGIAEGSLRRVDPDLASNLLLSFAVGLLAMGLLDPFGADWGRVAQEGMDMLLSGIEGDQAE